MDRQNIMNLRVYSINTLCIEETVKKVKITGKEGNFTILPRHIDYISSFNDCNLVFTDLNNNNRYTKLTHGVLIKTGRDVQIVSFNAIGNETSLNDLKLVVSENILNNKKIEESERKLKRSLQNIEIELLKRIIKI